MRGAVFLLALTLICLGAAPAAAQDDAPGFAAGVTEDEIAVTSDFRGARLTVFGSVPQGRSGDVVVVIRGPGGPVTVSRRVRVVGLWLNADPVPFEGAPSFFAVMSTKPLPTIASESAIWELGLDPAGAARLAGPTPRDADPAEYRRALNRLKRAKNLYQEDPRGVSVREGGLYIARVQLPANAPPGDYRAEVYLFRQGELVASDAFTIPINRIGLELTIHNLAHRFPVTYGLATVALALACGWAASVLLRGNRA